MRNPRKSACFALVACACVTFASLSFALLPRAAKSAASAPIVLRFGETPILFGPHGHWVAAIVFSPDGKTVATAAHDGYIRLWDAGTGRLKSVMGNDSTGTSRLAFSPDGRRVAAVGRSLGVDVQIWDTTTSRLVLAIEEHSGSLMAPASKAEPAPAPAPAPFLYKGKPIAFRPVNGVAFSPDGNLLATCGDGVILRDSRSGNIAVTLKQPAEGINDIAFSPDGKSLATAADDGKVRVWSVPAGVLEATLDGPREPLSAVAFSPDGTNIVAAGNGKRSLFSPNRVPPGCLRWWERANGLARQINLGNVRVGQLAFVGPTTVLVTAGRDLLSFDLAGGKLTPARKFWSHSEDVLAVAVSPDRRLVATGGQDNTVDLIDVAAGKSVHRLPGLVDRFSSVAASTDGKRFATATIDHRFTNGVSSKADAFDARYREYFSGGANAGRVQPGEVRIWTTRDGRLQSVLPLASCQVTAIDFIPRSEQLAVAGWVPGKGGMLSLWDSNTSRRIRDFATQAAEILSIAVSPDGRTLASGDAGGNLDLWDLRLGTKRRSQKQDGRIEAVTYSADGKWLAVGDASRNVRLFDASEGGGLLRMLKSRSHVKSLKFSPDGNLLAAGTSDPGLELWDLRSSAESRTLKASGDHFDRMPGLVAFSPDGRFVVTNGHGKDIAVFDTSTGKIQTELRGHIHPATAAVFLPDGRLLSGGGERALRLWDVERRQLLATWIALAADSKQDWPDEWVGFKPSGQFAGSTRLDRLRGWKLGEDVVIGPEDGVRRRRVETLFQTDGSTTSTKN